jgi:hypothetical protein
MAILGSSVRAFSATVHLIKTPWPAWNSRAPRLGWTEAVTKNGIEPNNCYPLDRAFRDRPGDPERGRRAGSRGVPEGDERGPDGRGAPGRHSPGRLRRLDLKPSPHAAALIATV